VVATIETKHLRINSGLCRPTSPTMLEPTLDDFLFWAGVVALAALGAIASFLIYVFKFQPRPQASGEPS
jgi:hypothetical protein